MTQPEQDSVEEILDWHNRMLMEAMFEADRTQKPIKIIVTQELIDKHKAKAKQALDQHYLNIMLELINGSNTWVDESRNSWVSPAELKQALTKKLGGKDE